MIFARNSQIICKIKPKSWLHVLGQGSGFLILGLRSWISGVGCYSTQQLLQIVKRNYYKLCQVLQSVAESNYKV